MVLNYNNKILKYNNHDFFVVILSFSNKIYYFSIKYTQTLKKINLYMIFSFFTKNAFQYKID